MNSNVLIVFGITSFNAYGNSGYFMFVFFSPNYVIFSTTDWISSINTDILHTLPRT